MAFWSQLGLLLWKNFLLRRRNKIRMVVEFLWPLVLFLILIWVRTRGLKENRPSCHVIPKAMPSIGGFEFFQNFLCTLNNTCYSSYVENDLSPWSGSQFNRLVTEATPVLEYLSRNSNQTRSTLSNIWNRLNTFSAIAYGLRSLERFKAKGTIKLREFIPAEKRKTFTDRAVVWTGVPASDLEGALETEVNMKELDASSIQGVFYDFRNGNCSHPEKYPAFNVTEKFIDVCSTGPRSNLLLLYLFTGLMDPVMAREFRSLLTIEKILTNGTDGLDISIQRPDDKILEALGNLVGIIRNEGQNFTQFILSPQALTAEDTARAFYFMCGYPGGKSNSSIFGLSPDSPTRYDSLRDALKDWNNDRRKVYQPDPQLSSNCNTLIMILEETPLASMIWKQIKPFLRGSILFSPNNEVTQDLMARLDAKFNAIKSIDKYFKAVVDVMHSIRRWLRRNSDDLKTAKIVLSDPEVLEDMFNLIGIGPEVSDRQQLFDAAQFLSRTDLEYIVSRLDMFAEILSEAVQCIKYNRTVAYDTEAEAVTAALPMLASDSVWAVIVFPDDINSNTTHLKYKIRMDSDKVDGTRFIRDRLTSKTPRRRPWFDLKYITYGFIYLQELVEQAWIEKFTNSSYASDFGVYMQQFPFPCHIYDQFIRAISRTFPLFMVLSWVYASAMIIKSIVLEKERHLREVMRVMGVNNSVIWSGWFVDSFVVMFFSATILSAVLKWGRVIEHADFTLIWVFMVSYTVSVIAFSFFVSTFFNRANSAAAAGGILFFVTYLPYNFLLIWEERLSWYHVMTGCLFSNVAFGFGCTYFARLEEDGVGAQWDRITLQTLADDDFNLGYCICMLWFDSFIYLILTFYLEAISPGATGVPRPWYFIFQKSTWVDNNQCKASAAREEVQPLSESDSSEVEDDPPGLLCGVWVQNLCKTHGNGKVAVRNLNLRFFEDQITSFLGHNGAGKTTTISMLTGLYPPTSGSAVIYGYDTRTQMAEIRKSLGICPQYNILFDRLTVVEHLRFYAGVKGRTDESLDAEIEQILIDLGIPEKRNTFPSKLSGGMKRKLSVAVAFVGGSKTVFLDEPTSGVDPFSRRSIWELLIKYKKGRTIILTTHFMDEADLLGDRIAIISQGQLKTCGSSLFLKNKFGKGYFLRLVRKTNPNLIVNGDSGENLLKSAKDFMEFVRKRLPESKFVDDVGTEVTFALPYEQVSKFPKLLSDIEENLNELQITSYGVSDTPLEDVFLRTTSEDMHVPDSLMRSSKSSVWCACCSSNEVKDAIVEDINQVPEELESINVVQNGKDAPAVKEAFSVGRSDATLEENDEFYPISPGEATCLPEVEYRQGNSYLLKHPGLYQVVTIVQKRMRNARRNLKAFFFEIILPIVFIALTLAFTLILPAPADERLQAVNPWVYPPPRYMFLSNARDNGTAQSDNASKEFQEQVHRLWDEITGPIGPGNACVKDNLVYKMCDGSWTEQNVQELEKSRRNVSKIDLPSCTCESGSQICDVEEDRHPPPMLKTRTGDKLMDVSRYNIPEWLQNTFKMYDNHRYGGYQFEQVPSSLSVSKAVKLLVSILLPNSTIITDTANEDHGVKNILKVWYENRGWLSSIAYLNAFSNVVLRANLPPDLLQYKDEFGISLSTHPLNLTDAQHAKESLKVSALGVVHAICIIFALSFIPASFTVYLIEERFLGGKHLHMVSGVKPVTYWTANFAYDMSKYLISAVLTVLLFMAFNATAYVSKYSIGSFVMLIILYGWATIPLMYPASYVFDIPSTAFVTLACSNLFIGVITTVSTFVLEQFGDAELDEIGDLLKQLFLVFPQYCLGRGLMELVRLDIFAVAQTNLQIQFTQPNRFKWQYLGKLLVCLAVQGAILFVVNVCLDYRQLVTRLFKQRPVELKNPIEEDDDVAEERRRVLKNYNPTVPLHAENLTKVYKHKPTPAVKSLCFEVREAECFGLLGINGAGKTSTFKMLTGDVRITGGKAILAGYDVERHRDSARKRFGYCPQEDGFDPLLNAFELLELYGKLRGMSPENAKESSVKLVQLLGLSPYAHRRSGTYSGGNKRKLSTAIALIGNPQVIFLDEPTSGMDPGARRQLWKVVLALVHNRKSIVLTSHSMEECEALCSRLGIMVNGMFVCLGSIQHLKNRFGRGYILTVKLGTVTEDNLMIYVKAKLPDAVLEESHLRQLKFCIKQDGIKLSAIFDAMQQAKEQSIIEDYSLSQTSLDDIFVRFASHQTDI